MDFRELFAIEGRERVAQMESLLIQVEDNPSNTELLDGLFREVHTMKGMAGTMDLKVVTEACHLGESLLDQLRSGERAATPTSIDVLLALQDYLGSAVDAVGDGAEEPDAGDLVERLQRLAEGVEEEDEGEKAAAPKKQDGPAKSERKSVVPSTIRVATDQLEEIVNIVGELVISKSRLKEIGKLSEQPDVEETVNRIDLLTTHLYENVLQTRMLPLRYVFDRFPRMVRDLSRKQKKEVELVIEGGDTEIDRSLMEELADPLVHILRNSIDHGVESPTERKKAGKPEAATVRISTGQEHSRVLIRVSDDGGGIDPKKVKERAIERGVLDPGEAENLSRNETYLLLCRPGFSTASQVTDTSGRGVGMDVVKSWVESVGGSLRIESEVGKGTTITLAVPLTTAILQGLVVEAGGDTFILPVDGVEETVNLQETGIRTVHGREVFTRLDGVLPLIRLTHLLDTGGRDTERFALIVEKHGRRAGLGIDQVLGQREVVLKEFDRKIVDAVGIGGATVLGDGRVAFILDVAGLLELAARQIRDVSSIGPAEGAPEPAS